jgi:hypothetical protein
MTRAITIAAHYNVDSNVVKAQLYVTDRCDSLYHPQDVISGTIQLFNVYTTPQTGLQEIALESVDFDKTYANADGYFAIFFINPAVTVNLEARATVNISGQGTLTALTTVLPDEGTFSDQPSTSVIGNAENRSWHTDKEPQRDGQGINQSPHDIPPLSEDNVVIPDPTIVNSVYADIQFEQLAELQSDEQLPGSLIYLGGGDRLLPKPGVLAFQTLDTPPWELGTSTFVEQAASELLPNNQYLQQATNGYPSGYSLVDSPGISVISTKLQTLQAEGFDAKAWTMQLNGAVPTSISPFNTASVGVTSPIAFDVSKPISLSILAGMTKDTGTTSITDAKLIFTYYDFADRELTSMSKAMDVDAMFNARPVRPFSISAKLSDYPPTTEKITWKLQLGSVEQGDFVTLITSVPSLSQTPFATSQITVEGSRVKDNLSFAPDVPFALEEGAAVISMAIGFQGTPTEEKYIFDSRSPGTLLNGCALKVEPTGELTFLISDDTTTKSLTSATVPAWSSGAVSEVVAEWSDTAPLMRITFDGQIIATDTSTALPANLGGVTTALVQLGSDANATKHIDSEFIRFTFLKRARS